METIPTSLDRDSKPRRRVVLRIAYRDIKTYNATRDEIKHIIDAQDGVTAAVRMECD